MQASICLILILLGLVTGCSSSGNVVDLSSLTDSVPSGSPASLTYTNPSSYFIKGTAISAITPLTLTGSPKSLSISPSLPAGLSLNSTTGVISGTPTKSLPPTTFTISALATDGTTATATLAFEIALPITVNSTADASDQTPGDEVCATVSSQCTLRAALEEATAVTGVLSLVSVPAGTYTVTSTLTLSSRMILTGASAGTTIISGGNAISRVLTIANYTVTLQNFSVQNGRDTTSANVDGVGISSTSDNLTLKNCDISNNTVNSNNATTNMNGVGLKALASATTGKVTIDSCTINNNAITMGAAVNFGIAAGLGAFLSAATVSITNSTFQGNSASGSNGSASFAVNGGAMKVITANFTLTSTTVSSNIEMLQGYFDVGGGIYYAGTGVGTIDGLTCNNNEASRAAGCLSYWTSSTAVTSITNSTFVGNIDHNGDGGGIFYRGSGSALTITNSYFEAGASGTTLLQTASTSPSNLTVKNSTFTSANHEGVYLYSSFAGTASFENCTFITTGTSNAFSKSFGASMLATFKNSIFEKTGAGAACGGSFSGVSTLGYNLARDASCTFLSGGSGDLISANPLLSATANNGGATKTAALASGSPARDAVPLASCPLSTDQRGTARPQGGLCDIGAYEY